MADREVDMTMDRVGELKPDAFKQALTDVEHAGPDAYPEGGSEQHSGQSQKLERYITFSAAIYFGTIILCSWEAFAVTFQFALYNGGPASMIYGSILVGFGVSAVAASLAELASIDASVGAQYRWSATLAPTQGRFFGLLQGWLTLFAWIMACGGVPATLAQIISALAIFNYPDYQPPYHNWHVMLIMWMLIIILFVLNLWVRKVLNMFETAAGIFHFLFFIVSIVVLLTLAQRSSNKFVWETLFVDRNGWSNPAINFNLGLLTVTFSVSGSDGLLHMCDEIKHVERRIPRSIIIAAVSNSVMLFAFVLVTLYCLGDLDTVLSDDTGLPIIQVYYLATKSKAGTTILVVLLAIIFFFGFFNAFASVSRLAWGFAKDNGLPFSPFFARISPRFGLPLNSLGLIAVMSFLLSIIYAISLTAFNAIISLQALALNVSYILPILFVCIRKIKGNDPPYGPFRLGRYGIPINVFALLYLCYIVIWMPFPQVLPVTADYFNYAGPIMGLVILGAIADYSINGWRRFKVPVKGRLSEVVA